MITLNLNMDEKQEAGFSDFDAMKREILKNPYKYDGLSFFDASIVEDDAVLTLRYIECYKCWEVEEYPTFESSSYTLHQAVDVFIECLQEYDYKRI